MINKKCKYYPCHKKVEDCTFCYCPLYPCLDDKLGEYLYKKDIVIWSCKDCEWIHKKSTVAKILAENPKTSRFKA